MFSTDYTVRLILTVFAALLALSVHEFSHAYAAYKLGDPTAHRLGRLSINPIKHLDPFGTLCMVFFHFGWARPVPIDPRYFKKPTRDFAITAFAGPLSNIILGFLSALVYLLCINNLTYTDNEFINNLLYNTVLFIFLFHVINVGLGVFNLLPIPPFDGSRIINVFLPKRIYFGIMKYERYIYWGVIAWLLLGTNVYRTLLSFDFIASSNLLSGIARIFSLSDLIADAISGVSWLMMKAWALLPGINF